MPRTLRYWLALGAAVTALVVAGWPGPAADPATLISRVSVVGVAAMLAGLPWLVRRRFGPLCRGWAPPLVRAIGCATAVALLAEKARVEHVEFAAAADRPSLAGLWAGEVIFLAVIAAYAVGLLAVTARSAPARRTTLIIGGGAGLVIGVVVYGLRPLADKLHIANPVLAVLYEVGKVLAVPLVLAGAIAASIAAARRASSRTAGLSLRDVRARQGLAAGACVGFAAAVVVSVLGIATIALRPHAATGLQWTLPGRGAPPGSVYHFEVGMTEAGAGFLLVLIIFPVVGAGLGAWAGMFAGDTGLRPDGGGGGGGPHGPDPQPRPPGGGRRAPAPPDLAPADLGRLLAGADWRIIAGPADLPRAPEHVPEPERVPAGVP
ncbi:MAG TPA: hypothetical protein VEJ42_06200 [Streptosporangiaceae bacterium]|nr:hypothetical protein [Streptosporangiaceae bacterium]